jgi:hypothetical protein
LPLCASILSERQGGAEFLAIIHMPPKDKGSDTANRGNMRLQLPLLMLSFPLLLEHYYEIFDYRILE